MKKIRFQNNDIIPSIGLGTWKAKEGEIEKALRSAIFLGYRHIDCASIYSNQIQIGESIRGLIKEGVVKREELFITSKLWNNRHRKGDVYLELVNTLKELKLDYLDLFLIHWPIAFKYDVIKPTKVDDFLSLKEVSLNETWEGMENCYKKGLVRHIGVSNFSIKKIKSLFKTAEIKPELNQVELHPYLPQKKLAKFSKENNILLTAYSPLGSKSRTWDKGGSIKEVLEDEIICSIAKKLNVTPANVILSWINSRGIVSVPKSVNPYRQKENLDSLNLTLEKEDIEKINSIRINYRYMKGKPFVIKGSEYTLRSIWDE